MHTQWLFCLLSDIDQLITISGMVIRTSQLIPEMQEAFFRCQVCAFNTRVEVDRGRIAEPAVCRNCNTTHSMALVHNRSVFSDKQMVSISPLFNCIICFYVSLNCLVFCFCVLSFWCACKFVYFFYYVTFELAVYSFICLLASYVNCEISFCIILVY